MNKFTLILVFAFIAIHAAESAVAQQKDITSRRIAALAEFLLEPRAEDLNDIFRLGKEQLDWHGANFFCEIAGWHLVSLQTTKDDIELRGFLSYYGLLDNTFWTSGNRLEDSETWRWGIGGAEVENANWGRNEPKNKTNWNCIYTAEDQLTLKTGPCSEYRDFICRRTPSA